MQHLPDFPPLPQCFSHLVVSSDGEPRSLRSHISSSLSRSSGKTEGFAKSESLDDFDHYIMNGTRSSLSCVNHINPDSEGLINTGSLSTVKSQIARFNQRNLSPHQSVPIVENSDVSPEQRNPFLKLQTSLQKLQREMKDLRYLDISLFCQLLSLHDAVQDFKNTVADRYSETGSEYSLGSASYMGSMSSLNDDSEWGDDGTTFTFSHDHPENSELVEESENTQSASSLLKQITELVLKADHDF
ncbi:unnamed protein product [Candidula unifasciata]|uniref:Uncharacterized protein n=1 Tax=Candidula unifasciata TaxID=100452 RepID=A0A8S3Z1B5_9EUPU|nr:unnamed protein product [Candidula unifasciata]